MNNFISEIFQDTNLLVFCDRKIYENSYHGQENGVAIFANLDKHHGAILQKLGVNFEHRIIKKRGNECHRNNLVR